MHYKPGMGIGLKWIKIDDNDFWFEIIEIDVNNETYINNHGERGVIYVEFYFHWWKNYELCPVSKKKLIFNKQLKELLDDLDSH